MRPPGLKVLRAQPRDELGLQSCSDVLQLWACDDEGDACAEVSEAADRRCRYSRLCRNVSKRFTDPVTILAWQPVKHCQMRAENIAVRGKMPLPKAIERLDIPLGYPRGDNKWLTGLQSKLPVTVVRFPGQAVRATSISRFRSALQAPSQAWADMP